MTFKGFIYYVVYVCQKVHFDAKNIALCRVLV